MEISMDPFGKTCLSNISLNVTGYMEISMDPLQVKAFLNNVSLRVTGYMEISVDPVAGLKIGGRTVASGELKLTRATKS